MTPSLEGKVAVITGGARGIGYAIAESFVAEGAKVVIADKDAEGARRACAELSRDGASAMPVEVDITDVAQIDAMVAATTEQFGSLDVLVNNAAHARFGFVLDFTEEDWEYTQDVSLKGNFFCAQRAARAMVDAGGGKIINISSMTVPLGHTRNVAYSSMKGAIEVMTKVFAVELAQYGIQVNAIAPGPVDTELSRAVLTEAGRAVRMTRLASGRFGTPQDIAGAAVFLASSAADWVTGSVVAVDGGYTATGVIEQRTPPNG